MAHEEDTFDQQLKEAMRKAGIDMDSSDDEDDGTMEWDTVTRDAPRGSLQDGNTFHDLSDTIPSNLDDSAKKKTFVGRANFTSQKSAPNERALVKTTQKNRIDDAEFYYERSIWHGLSEQGPLPFGPQEKLLTAQEAADTTANLQARLDAINKYHNWPSKPLGIAHTKSASALLSQNAQANPDTTDLHQNDLSNVYPSQPSIPPALLTYDSSDVSKGSSATKDKCKRSPSGGTVPKPTKRMYNCPAVETALLLENKQKMRKARMERLNWLPESVVDIYMHLNHLGVTFEQALSIAARNALLHLSMPQGPQRDAVVQEIVHRFESWAAENRTHLTGLAKFLHGKGMIPIGSVDVPTAPWNVAVTPAGITINNQMTPFETPEENEDVKTTQDTENGTTAEEDVKMEEM